MYLKYIKVLKIAYLKSSPFSGIEDAVGGEKASIKQMTKMISWSASIPRTTLDFSFPKSTTKTFILHPSDFYFKLTFCHAF